MGKVEKIVEKVIENEQEVEELLGKQSIEDLYEFFLAKDRSLTAEEFDKEVYDILEYYSKNISMNLEELEESETEQIAGGKSDFIKKSLSASLCALMLTSGINVSASSKSVNPSTQKTVSVLNNKKQESSVNFGEKIKAWVKKNKKALIITGSVTGAVLAGIIVSVVVYKHKKNTNNSKNTVTAPIQQEVKQQSEQQTKEFSKKQPEQHTKQQSKTLSKNQPKGGTKDKSSEKDKGKTNVSTGKQTHIPENGSSNEKNAVQRLESNQQVNATTTSEKHSEKSLTVAERRKIYSGTSNAVFPNVPRKAVPMLQQACITSAELNFNVRYDKAMQDFKKYSEGFSKTMNTLSIVQKNGGNTKGFLERVKAQLGGLNSALSEMKKLETQSKMPYLSSLSDDVRNQLTTRIGNTEKEVVEANETLHEVFKDEIQKMDNWASMVAELQTNSTYLLQGLKNGANT